MLIGTMLRCGDVPVPHQSCWGPEALVSSKSAQHRQAGSLIREEGRRDWGIGILTFAGFTASVLQATSHTVHREEKRAKLLEELLASCVRTNSRELQTNSRRLHSLCDVSDERWERREAREGGARGIWRSLSVTRHRVGRQFWHTARAFLCCVLCVEHYYCSTAPPVGGR